ncbi:MAG: Holliday junction resolvase, partial [Candidatus Altiarchaeota archaeon]|nr:Holliday junction resolvase [Candidatus Altiarchaeota archaeon]
MGMGARYKKGSDFERFIVNSFWERGWVALRAAGSGKTDKPLPDVIAVKNGRIILIECKTTTKDRLSLHKAVDNLMDFSR